MSLRAEDLSVAYDQRTVIREMNLEIPAGRVTAIVGPNACGKSTLLRALARLLAPTSGAVLLDGEQIHRMRTKEVARRLGLLPQQPVAPEGLSVEDLVGRGRYPHQRFMQQFSDADERQIEWALEVTATEPLRRRPLDELSGGQRQRAWIAMALAQDTGVLLLDEPTTFLDLAHQVDVLELVSELNEGSGKTIVLVLHDLNQACRYAHHLIALKDGEVWARGNPADVISAELVESVFGLRVAVVPDPVEGTPMCVPIGRVGRRMADVGAADEAATPAPADQHAGAARHADGDRAAQPPAAS